MASWLKKINFWFGATDELPENFFDDLDLLRVLNIVLPQLMELSGAKNVVWIRDREFQHYHSVAKGLVVLEPGKTYMQESRLKSIEPLEEKELVDVLKDFEPGHLSAQTKTQAGEQQVLLSVAKPSDRSVFGYFLCLGINQGRHKKAIRESGRFLSLLEKHLSFCVEHWDVKSEGYQDDLTGLYNQKYLAKVVESEIFRSTRAKEKFSVLFIDIDYFKNVNDNQGHIVGSKLLIELGHLFENSIRRSDYAFRYGGDEFVVVLPETDSEGATVTAERLRSVVEAYEFAIEGVQLQITLSIGIATYPDHAQSHKDILKMADEAMYSGKAKSRNIVILAS